MKVVSSAKLIRFFKQTDAVTHYMMHFATSRAARSESVRVLIHFFLFNILKNCLMAFEVFGPSNKGSLVLSDRVKERDLDVLEHSCRVDCNSLKLLIIRRLYHFKNLFYCTFSSS